MAKHFSQGSNNNAQNNVPNKKPRFSQQGSAPRYSQPGAGYTQDGYQNASYQQDGYAQPHKNHHERAREDTSLVYGSLANSPKKGHYSKSGRRKKSKAPLIILAVVLVLILGVAGVGGYFAWNLYNSANTAKGYINNVISTATDLSNTDDISASLQSISGAVDSIQTDAAAAKAEVSGPLWEFAAKLPVIGSDIASVQSAANILDDFAQTTLPELKAASDTISTASLSGEDGSLNLEPIITLSSQLTSADELLAKQVEDLNAVPDSKIEQIQSALDKGRTKLTTLYEALDEVTGLVNMIPSLLGSDGTRNYLLIAQTNAEVRTAGGLAGSVGSFTTDNGNISFNDFHSDQDFPTGNVANLLGEGEASLWDGYGFGYYECNVTCEADYPTLAQMMAQYWTQQEWAAGETVDGVMSVDPVALGAILEITGPVVLSDSRVLDSSNTADFLLNTVYLEIATEDQDKYFQETAQQVIANMFSNMDSSKLFQFARKMLSLAEDRHVYFWSFHDEDTEILRKANLTHEVTNDASEPVLGLYYNEAKASKIDYYARRTTKITKSVVPEGTQYHVTMTLNNVLEASALSGLTTYITANTPDGSVQDDFVIMPPAGATISNLKCSDGSTFTEITAYERTNYRTRLVVAPEQSVTVEFDVTCEEGAADLVLDQTPQCTLENGITYEY